MRFVRVDIVAYIPQPSVYARCCNVYQRKVMLIFIKSRVNAHKQKESAILCKRSLELMYIYCSNRGRVITTIFYKSMTTRSGCKPVDFVGSATRALVQLHYKLYNRAPYSAWPILLIFFLVMGVTLRRIYTYYPTESFLCASYSRCR